MADRSPTPIRERTVTFGPHASTVSYYTQQPVADQRSSEAHPFPPLPPAASAGNQDQTKLNAKQKRSMRFLSMIKKRWREAKPPLPPRPPWTESPKGKGKGQGKGKNKWKNRTKTQGKGKNKVKHEDNRKT